MAIRSSATSRVPAWLLAVAVIFLAAAVTAVFCAVREGLFAAGWLAVLLSVTVGVTGVLLGLLAAWGNLVRSARLQAGLREEIADLSRKVRQGQSVILSTPNGVVSVDCSGYITLFNPSAESLFGVEAVSVVGQKIEDADIHPELARLAYDCISTHKNLSTELKLPGWPVRVLGVRSVSLGGSVPGADCVMLVIQDLSDIRRKQMREREFVSNVSHELRTPITAILTTTEALAGGAKNDPDVVDRFLGTIMSEGRRLSALIEDLLEVTKRDYGIVTSKISKLLVHELVERAVGAVRPQAGLKGVDLLVSVPEGVVAYADETQLVRLVRNLVDNAVKYTPEEGLVRVTVHKEADELVVAVADTGIGIPQGEVDRIFERFYRVDKARSRRMGGTGLGLAIVKDIADSCGGSISVDTQLGAGSTFTVRLPVRWELSAPDDPAEQPA